MSAKKKYFTINFTHLIHKTCKILSTFTNQCHCLHLTVSAFIFLTLTPNIPSSSLSFLYISSSLPSTALDPSQSHLVRCATLPLRSTLTKYYICISWFINLFESMKIPIFSTDGVNGVKN